MNPLLFTLIPFINLGTQFLKKTAAKKVPKWAMPFVNVGLGVGLVYGAGHLGIPVTDVVDPGFLQCLDEGLAVGGAATIAHNVARHATKE